MGQFDSPIISRIIIIIIIIVVYINRRMSIISSRLSTKTFAIVNISDFRGYRILTVNGTTLLCNKLYLGKFMSFTSFLRVIWRRRRRRVSTGIPHVW